MEVAKTIRNVSFALLGLGIVGAIILGIAENFIICIMSLVWMIILFVFMYGLAEILDWISAIYRKLDEI